MLEHETIIKVISVLGYIGFFISSINGFIETGKEFNFCQLMTCITVMISSIGLISIDMLWNDFIDTKHLYYCRCIAILHYSILAIGMSEVGIGFGIIGMMISIINLFSGVFMDGDLMIYSVKDLSSRNTNDTLNSNTNSV